MLPLFILFFVDKPDHIVKLHRRQGYKGGEGVVRTISKGQEDYLSLRLFDTRKECVDALREVNNRLCVDKKHV
jgi:hypothetical protein